MIFRRNTKSGTSKEKQNRGKEEVNDDTPMDDAPIANKEHQNDIMKSNQTKNEDDGWTIHTNKKKSKQLKQKGETKECTH